MVRVVGGGIGEKKVGFLLAPMLCPQDPIRSVEGTASGSNFAKGQTRRHENMVPMWYKE